MGQLGISNKKPVKGFPLEERIKSYKRVKLTTDTNQLSEAEKLCLFHLIKAAEQIDLVFWEQTYMDKESAFRKVKDSLLKEFMEINYGPWDRLNGNMPFMEGVGSKPLGANYYPEGFDISKMGKSEAELLLDPYVTINKIITVPEGQPMPMQAPPDPNSKMPPKRVEMIPLNTENGGPITEFVEFQRFGEQYQAHLSIVKEHMDLAAKAIESEDSELANYLRMRAVSLIGDRYIESDIEWLKLNSRLDIIIGPIENYEDKLAGRKTAYEAFVLVRDKEWGEKLKQYLVWLPKLQAELPVKPEYKPVLGASGTEGDDMAGMPVMAPNFPPIPRPSAPQSQLAVFDAVFYAGDCNAGSKTIAVNLPNHEVLQEHWGTRRSQLKNTMRLKFDHILLPISKEVMHKSQRKNVTFDAFFNNVMFHEVAHGLGVKNLVANPEKTAREALGASYAPLEECKADVLGLYMVTSLHSAGVLKGKLEDFYITFVASVYRSVRFGASSAHGKANMVIYNTLMSKGCLESSDKGLKVNVSKMKDAIKDLAAELLYIQGDGDVERAQKMLSERGGIDAVLKSQLDMIQKKNIPVDLVFDQGIRTLGLDRFESKK